MPGNKQKRPTGGVYDDKEVGRRIDDRRIELGLQVKDVLAELGWDKGEYSRKTRGLTPLFLGECSKLFVLLKGWTGFPFVDKAEGSILDAIGAGRLAEILDYLAKHPPKSGR